MKIKIGATLVAAVLFTLSVFAADLHELMNGNTSLARTIRQYEREGYVVVEGDQTYYNQARYFAEPTAPYYDGSGQVTLRKSAGNYSLTTTYVTITFDATTLHNGRSITHITGEYTQTVY